MAVRMLRSRLPVLSGRTVRVQKVADPHLLTTEHKKWREVVLQRAKYQCQRCGARDVVLYADHIVERLDGGDLLDPNNGQALCPSCHTTKTYEEKRKRLGLQ